MDHVKQKHQDFLAHQRGTVAVIILDKASILMGFTR